MNRTVGVCACASEVPKMCVPCAQLRRSAAAEAEAHNYAPLAGR